MAKSAEELVGIFKSIKTRIKSGTKSYESLHKIFTKRAEMEEQFAQMLKQLIPSDIDKDDTLLQSVLSEIRTESEIHQKFAAEIKSKVTQPMDKDGKHIKDTSKNMLADIKKTSAPVKKAVTEAQKAYKSLEEANNALKTTPPVKRDAQNKKIAKLSSDFDQKAQKANQSADSLKGMAVPKITKDFGDFDADRLNKMQKYTVTFVANKKLYLGRIIDGCADLNTQATSFDASDRSGRTVQNIFSGPRPGARAGGKDQPLIVIAIADYRSEDPRDLTLRRGDRIIVLMEHRTGWWEGQLEGTDKKGIFPRTYVEFADLPRNQPIPIDAIFNVRSDFKSQGQGQIDLLNGDFAFVDVLQRDGYCRGINLRSRQKGAFPLSSLDTGQP